MVIRPALRPLLALVFLLVCCVRQADAGCDVRNGQKLLVVCMPYLPSSGVYGQLVWDGLTEQSKRRETFLTADDANGAATRAVLRFMRAGIRDPDRIARTVWSASQHSTPLWQLPAKEIPPPSSRRYVAWAQSLMDRSQEQRLWWAIFPRHELRSLGRFCLTPNAVRPYSSCINLGLHSTGISLAQALLSLHEMGLPPPSAQSYSPAEVGPRAVPRDSGGR
jgi:hypothetical protein